MARGRAILGLSERCPKSCLWHIQSLWLLGIGHLGFLIHAGSGSCALGHPETASPCLYYFMNHPCQQVEEMRLGRFTRPVHSHLASKRQGKGLDPRLTLQPGSSHSPPLTRHSHFLAPCKHMQQDLNLAGFCFCHLLIFTHIQSFHFSTTLQPSPPTRLNPFGFPRTSQRDCWIWTLSSCLLIHGPTIGLPQEAKQNSWVHWCKIRHCQRRAST